MKNPKAFSSIRKETDELLAVSKGDMAAFERIFFAYNPNLVYFLTGMIHDVDASRDMAQEIFLSLWENHTHLAQVQDFSAYLFQIARYTVYNYYDHLGVEEKYITDYLTKHSACYASEEEVLFAKELSEHIDTVVRKMSPQRQKVYVLSRKEGLSNEQIAEMLHISKRTVENHLTAVLTVLRRTVLLEIYLWYLR